MSLWYNLIMANKKSERVVVKAAKEQLVSLFKHLERELGHSDYLSELLIDEICSLQRFGKM